MSKSIVPYNDSKKSKTAQVRDMFDNISRKYDFLNHFLSFGIDHYWRARMVRIASREPHARVLDIATGTGDQAIRLAKKLSPQRIDAVDLSEKMMEVGREKVKKAGLEELIHFQKADCQSLPFEHNTFDIVTVSFGVRNFENLAQSLSEIHRVLKPGGLLLILEFSHPTSFPIKQLYSFYNKCILPLIGFIVSGDKRAYTYLPESIKAFPSGKNFANILRTNDFIATRFTSMTGGIATIYSGIKGKK
ncbi:MAG: bifunctional demethylmenaquinone methyltransferase/2-methoxy-6-polyprenyl-1,4-benzoquinol methylase UbiE [Flavobacteriales bacterium]|nr:bifunctional demethylmenaquinone methyltransferase/2-methoxy-6-polyprenyl-1,4-benzoquinol methylase UbiE [Flavobacteriales bacterium]